MTVSAVPVDDSSEVGGHQNTVTNFGASPGTALAGSLLITTLSSSFLANVGQPQAIPLEITQQAQVELAGGVPFVSDDDLEAALVQRQVDSEATDSTPEAYAEARISGLREPFGELEGVWNEVPESHVGIIQRGADDLRPFASLP